MSAFGLTSWAVNRLGWAFGYYPYYNPYYGAGTTYVDNSVYDYSQPIVMMPEEQTLSADPADTAPPPGVSQEALTQFDKARQQFYAGQYDQALESVNAAIKEMPNDAVLHEFRALTLFALGRYQEAAGTLYPVLSAGPGWDWTTMIGLYPSVQEYTKQLRALEAYRNQNPDDTAARFVLAYQYLTAGHADAAKSELQALLKRNPKDELATRLLLELDPQAQVATPPEVTEPPKPTSTIDASQIQGTWTAQRSDGSRFEMQLNNNKDFGWTYTGSGGEPQKVTGVWGVDEDGVIALEMNDGGTMLAQLDQKSPTKIDFYMLGDTRGTEPLHFIKQ
jgi:tetratricopeptide (TPR) repeat protein